MGYILFTSKPQGTPFSLDKESRLMPTECKEGWFFMETQKADVDAMAADKSIAGWSDYTIVEKITKIETWGD